MECFDVKKFFSNWRGVLLLLGGLAVLGLVGGALWCIPSWQVEHVQGKPLELAKLKDEHRRTLAQILAGGGLLVGLYLGWRRVRAAEEGQITERFTKAIEQLGQEGDDNMAIRLGGIYALERIARDSEKDHGPIMEVLTAYVREKAPRKNDDYEPQAADERPPTDIQAILTVIGRRETTGKGRRNDRLNLSKTHLVGAELTEAKLDGAILSDADLSKAHLSDAYLSGAHLRGAHLRGTILIGTDLTGTILSGADLALAHLELAKNLTTGDVKLAKNWRKAQLPDYLNHLKDLPD